ncbi:MAG: hypothetical protein KF763_07570 [Cyclobacteriaceae bacterium]|nr:hypothetical protein [Cyclobacteriaceae bacterium]
MKKKECPSCAMEIDADLNTCPICQYEFPQRVPAIKWVAILLVAVLLATLIIYNFV